MNYRGHRITFPATIPLEFKEGETIAEVDARITVDAIGFPVAIEVRILGGEEYVDVMAQGVSNIVFPDAVGAAVASAAAASALRWLRSKDGRRAVADARTDVPSPAAARNTHALLAQRGLA